VLQWARANGAPWNVHVCSGAARSGHLAVLQWARANGAPWDAYTREAAEMLIGSVALDILAWLDKNGCPERGPDDEDVPDDPDDEL
jgi:hypothetical protein